MKIVNCLFTSMYSFNIRLQEKLDEKGWKAAELARRSGITKQNIGRLLRSTPHATSGAPARPQKETVLRLARALDWDEDDALTAADWAPTQPIGPPQNRRELLDALERIGVAHIEFHDDIDDKSPEQLQEIFDVIQIAVELTLTKQGKQ